MGATDGPAKLNDNQALAWTHFFARNTSSENAKLLEDQIKKGNTVIYVQNNGGKLTICDVKAKGAIKIDLSDGLSRDEAKALGIDISKGINKVAAQGWALSGEKDIQTKDADVSVIDNDEIVKFDQAVQQYADAKGWTFEEAQAAYYANETDFSRQDLDSQKTNRLASVETLNINMKDVKSNDDYLAKIKVEMGITDDNNPILLNLKQYIADQKLDLSKPDDRAKANAYIMKNASASQCSKKFQSEGLKLPNPIGVAYDGPMDLASVKAWAPTAKTFEAATADKPAATPDKPDEVKGPDKPADAPKPDASKPTAAGTVALPTVPKGPAPELFIGFNFPDVDDTKMPKYGAATTEKSGMVTKKWKAGKTPVEWTYKKPAKGAEMVEGVMKFGDRYYQGTFKLDGTLVTGTLTKDATVYHIAENGEIDAVQKGNVVQSGFALLGDFNGSLDVTDPDGNGGMQFIGKWNKYSLDPTGEMTIVKYTVVNKNKVPVSQTKIDKAGNPLEHLEYNKTGGKARTLTFTNCEYNKDNQLVRGTIEETVYEEDGTKVKSKRVLEGTFNADGSLKDGKVTENGKVTYIRNGKPVDATTAGDFKKSVLPKLNAEGFAVVYDMAWESSSSAYIWVNSDGSVGWGDKAPENAARVFSKEEVRIIFAKPEEGGNNDLRSAAALRAYDVMTRGVFAGDQARALMAFLPAPDPSGKTLGVEVKMVSLRVGEDTKVSCLTFYRQSNGKWALSPETQAKLTAMGYYYKDENGQPILYKKREWHGVDFLYVDDKIPAGKSSIDGRKYELKVIWPKSTGA